MNKYSIHYKFKIIQNLIDISFARNLKITGSNFNSIYHKYLIQKFMHLGANEFFNDKNFNTLIKNSNVQTKSFKISRENGFESVSIIIFIKLSLIFFMLWTLLFFYYFIVLIFNKNKKPRKRIIIFGTEYLNFDNHEIRNNFIEFLKKHISVKSRDEVLVSSNSKIIVRFKNFIFKKYPHNILFNSGLKLNDFIKIQLLHFTYLFIFIRDICIDRRSSILAKDFALMSLFDFANNKKLIKSIIFTNSNMDYQPLWSSNYINRNFSTSMFWYSENSSPVVRDINDNKRYFNQYHPYLSLLNIDNHYVWTKSFANTLKKFTSFANCFVIGPILWKNIDRHLKLNPCENNILIFDVPVFSDEFHDATGRRNEYYSYKNMKKFILDIIDCKNNFNRLSNTKLILKSKKRGASPFFDKKYQIFLKKLQTENKIEIIDPKLDMQHLIQNSSLVICVPFTSPLILANHLRRNCIYYDPTGTVLPYDGHGEFLIKGKKSLREFLKN